MTEPYAGLIRVAMGLVQTAYGFRFLKLMLDVAPRRERITAGLVETQGMLFYARVGRQLSYELRSKLKGYLSAGFDLLVLYVACRSF
jgi:hypothetical protein